MDEKGFLLGVGNECKIIYDKGFGGKQLVQDGNQENVTVIECVSATGKAIAPLIIFKGKQHQESWYSNTNAADAFFAVSDQGWTNSEIALEWLQRDFDPQTKSQAQNGHQLLLINGYSSHTSYEFLEYCLQNKIIPFCMPSHSTHHLQPLDVSAFRLYQHYYSQAIDEESRLLHGVLDIGKHNFWVLLQRARLKTFTLPTISSGWRKSGLYPFNPRLVYSLLPGNKTPESRKNSDFVQWS